MADSIEDKRISKMEQLLTRLETLVEQWVIRHQDDINELKKAVGILTEHDEAFQKEVSTSCSLMNSTTDKKVSDAKDSCFDFTREVRKENRVLVALLVSSFIGAVMYFNDAKSDTNDKINVEIAKMHVVISEGDKPVIENGTNIKAIMNTVDKILIKLEKDK